MARSIRYIIPDLPHHAIQRGNNRQNIFYDPADRNYFLSKLKGIAKKAENYKYSSVRANLLGEKNNLITRDIIKKDRKRYRSFFYDLEADDPKHIREIEITAEQQKALGSNKFITWLENRLGACLRVKGRGRPSKNK